MTTIDETTEIPAAVLLRKRLLERAGLSPEEIRERLLGEIANALAAPDQQEPAAPEHKRPTASAWPEADGFATPEAFSGPLMDEAARLYSVLNPPMSLGIGLTVQFIAANPDEGTSTLARAFALIATTHSSGRVLLLDTDWSRNTQYAYFNQPDSQATYGALGQPVELGVNASGVVRSPASGYGSPLAFHPVGNTNLVVSRYTASDTPALSNHPSFWQELRRSVSICVVDSQPMARSMDGIVLCGSMDGVVLVVEAEATRIPVIEDLRDKMLSHGANVVGMVFNKRRFYIPKRIYQWL